MSDEEGTDFGSEITVPNAQELAVSPRRDDLSVVDQSARNTFGNDTSSARSTSQVQEGVIEPADGRCGELRDNKQKYSSELDSFKQKMADCFNLLLNKLSVISRNQEMLRQLVEDQRDLIRLAVPEGFQSAVSSFNIPLKDIDSLKDLSAKLDANPEELHRLVRHSDKP